MNSKFTCPTCEQPLEKELHPAKAPKPYVQLFCASRQCLGTVANVNGGSGPTEEAAYRSLCLAVDNETEDDTEPWEGATAEEVKERREDKTADHNRKRAIGL